MFSLSASMVQNPHLKWNRDRNRTATRMLAGCHHCRNSGSSCSFDFDIFAVRNYISNLYGELRFSDLFWVFLVFVEAARHTCTVVDVLRWSESTRFWMESFLRRNLTRFPKHGILQIETLKGSNNGHLEMTWCIMMIRTRYRIVPSARIFMQLGFPLFFAYACSKLVPLCCGNSGALACSVTLFLQRNVSCPFKVTHVDLQSEESSTSLSAIHLFFNQCPTARDFEPHDLVWKAIMKIHGLEKHQLQLRSLEHQLARQEESPWSSNKCCYMMLPNIPTYCAYGLCLPRQQAPICPTI
jgi:hypothetical protein